MGRPPDHVFQPEGRPTAGASEPLGDSLAASFSDGTVRIYGPSGDVRRTWKAGEKGFVALAFSGDGRRLVGGGRDGRVTVAESKTGARSARSRRRRQDRGRSPSRATGASSRRPRGPRPPRSGRRAARASSRSRRPSRRLRASPWRPAGDRVAVAFTDVDVRLVDAATGRVASTISDLEMAAFCLAFSPDGRLLAAGARTAASRSATRRRARACGPTCATPSRSGRSRSRPTAPGSRASG